MLSEKVLIFLIIELDVQRALDSSFDVLSNNLHLNRSQPQCIAMVSINKVQNVNPFECTDFR